MAEYERVTHDEWWVYILINGKWELECSCLSKEDAKKVQKSLEKVINVDKTKIEKNRIRNNDKDSRK